jgi:trafficking protein particle complex subunit 8
MGASHEPLKHILQEAENAKVSRSMYAETHRERQELLQAISQSEWNTETNPVVIIQQCANVVRHSFEKG